MIFLKNFFIFNFWIKIVVSFCKKYNCSLIHKKLKFNIFAELEIFQLFLKFDQFYTIQNSKKTGKIRSFLTKFSIFNFVMKIVDISYCKETTILF